MVGKTHQAAQTLDEIADHVALYDSWILSLDDSPSPQSLLLP